MIGVLNIPYLIDDNSDGWAIVTRMDIRKARMHPNDFPNAMSYYDKAVSIPIFYDLKKSELKFISDTIKSILR